MLARDLKQNSWGRRRQRRQHNKTNYKGQKAHVNMWNKADICAVLRSNETAPFPRPLSKRGRYSKNRTSVVSFQFRDTGVNRIQRNDGDVTCSYISVHSNIRGNQSRADMLNKIRELRRNIFLAFRRWRCRPRLLPTKRWRRDMQLYISSQQHTG